MVYGFNVRTPLDVLYSGWRDKTKASMAVSEWVEDLADRVEMVREAAALNGLSLGRRCMM